jgi:hypothetical protein
MSNNIDEIYLVAIGWQAASGNATDKALRTLFETIIAWQLSFLA